MSFIPNASAAPIIAFSAASLKALQSIRTQPSNFEVVNTSVSREVQSFVSAGPKVTDQVLVDFVLKNKGKLREFCMTMKARFSRLLSHPLYVHEFRKLKAKDLPRFLWASSTCEDGTLQNGIVNEGLAWCFYSWHYCFANDEGQCSSGSVEHGIVTALMDLGLVRIMAPSSRLLGGVAAASVAGGEGSHFAHKAHLANVFESSRIHLQEQLEQQKSFPASSFSSPIKSKFDVRVAPNAPLRVSRVTRAISSSSYSDDDEGVGMGVASSSNSSVYPSLFSKKKQDSFLRLHEEVVRGSVDREHHAFPDQEQKQHLRHIEQENRQIQARTQESRLAREAQEYALFQQQQQEAYAQQQCLARDEAMRQAHQEHALQQQEAIYNEQQQEAEREARQDEEDFLNEFAGAPSAAVPSAVRPAPLVVKVQQVQQDAKSHEYALVNEWAQSQDKITIHVFDSHEHKGILCRAVNMSGGDCQHTHQPQQGGLCTQHFKILKKAAQNASMLARRK